MAQNTTAIYEIIPAAAEDLAAVRQYDRHIPADRLAASIADGAVYVLRQGSRVVGTLRFSLFWQTIPFLDLLYLDEAFRGQGLGTRMMAHWEAAMAAKGYSHVMLSTQADESAQYFYAKLGYSHIGSFLPPEQEAEELMFCKTL